MDDVDGSHRASFRSSLLVALGWYATVIAAALLGTSGIPTAPDRDCSAMFSCLTAQEQLGLLALVGAPFLAGLLVITLALTGLLARRLPSSILAGTLSVLGSLAVAAVAGAAWQAAR
ncbi:hypothetical protein K7640_05765 [Micromonospora sp. PLK6-60]|uniref:hypothetical protein n=1 Tax=Micromonospora sp. PLK6-60 TaxID=2873383 RepID=UPI001CA715B1|nr:hypothetical protein [Micromonospora sp. PLK6-60]MBY8871348.1 hypothetical protein [Micromonospora sp. PLK6-60]